MPGRAHRISSGPGSVLDRCGRRATGRHARHNDGVLLTPAESDRLLLFTAAQLARHRRARGLRLNVPEAIAVIADTVAEAARDGVRHADALAAGRRVLTAADVLDGVPGIVTEVRVEAVFEDGSRLVVVPDPIGPAPGHGPYPGAVLPAGTTPASSLFPGAPGVPGAGAAPNGAAAVDADADVDAAADADVDVDDVDVDVDVWNTAAVPVSVSSHFHFFEVNPRLSFDRAAGFGRHLAVPPGATVRFDPGTAVRVRLTPFGGDRVVIGFSGLVDGPLDGPGARERALERAREFGYLDTGAPQGDALGRARNDHPDQPDLSDQPDQPDLPDRQDQPDQPDHPDRPDQPDRRGPA
jgi:urease subunit gamma/beta